MASGPWASTPRGASAWARDHGRVVAEMVDFLGRHAVTSLTVWLLVGIALALPSGLFLAYRSVAVFDDGWGGEPGFAIYLDRRTDEETVAALVAELERDSGVDEVWVVSPTVALETLQNRLGDLSGIAADNPLPITVRATFTSLATAASTFRRVERNSEVGDLSSDLDWLNRLNAVRTLLASTSLKLGAGLGLGALLSTFASIRLVLTARLEELRVMHFVGAPRSYIRRPFLYLGALYGIGGGGVAAMLLAGSFKFLEAPFQAFLVQYDLALEMVGFDPIFLGSLLAGGGILGVFGSILASRSRLKLLEITD